jgi:dienelactone hydrolase
VALRVGRKSFWGDALDVRFAGLDPAAPVTVSARSGPWTAAAQFGVAPDGTLDLATRAPESGSYTGADPDGLLWSMTDTTAPGTLESYAIAFQAEQRGPIAVAATLTRSWAPDGAPLVQVSEQGLVGVFVAPTAPGPHPGLVTWGGSEGGLRTGQLLAEYYASLGYACLGLAYFGAPGLPSELARIPLEYFGTALGWLLARPEVDPNRIGVMGGSRGGELALLVGATFPAVKAVVATVPSGVVWAGNTSALGPPPAAWTHGGRDLPFIPSSGAAPAMGTDAAGNSLTIEAPMFWADLAAASTTALALATIPVERIGGPVLIIAGKDDQLWASCRLSSVAVDRLMLTGHSATYADQFECYDAAGHSIVQPGLPTTGSDETYLGFGLGWFALGGTPAGNAHAARAADAQIRAFLATNL